VRTDALVPRDLFRGQSARDQPQDLDLSVGQGEVAAGAVQQYATRHRPTDECAEREPRRSAHVHGGTNGGGLRRRF